MKMISLFFSSGIVNLFNSLIALLITLIVAKDYGVAAVGELYIVLGLCSISVFPNVVLPPNFSIVRIQRSQRFSSTLLNSYIYTSPIIALISILILFGRDNFDVLLGGAFALFSSWINFFDILLQSKGRLKEYYISTLIGNIAKLVCIALFPVGSFPLSQLLAIYVLGQLINLIFLINKNKEFGRKISVRKNFKKFLCDYKLLYPQVKGFYLSALFKRVFDNVPALFMSNYLSSVTMGTFAIYFKVLVFGNGFVKIIESFLLNKKINEKITLTGKIASVFTCIFVTFISGLIYLYFTVGVDFLYLSWTASLLLPLSIIVFLRAKCITKLNMKPVNISIMLSIIMANIYMLIFNKDTLLFAMSAYSILIFVMALSLILFESFKSE